MKKYLSILFCISFFAACKNDSSNEVKPIHKDIAEIVFASGSLESDDKYNLTAQTDGNIIKLNIEEGDKIAIGEIVAIIDNKQNIINTKNANEQLKIAQYNNTTNAPLLQQISANLDAAKEKLSQDIIQEKRYQDLFNENSVTKIELEKMQLATKTSKANVAALQQQYKSIQQQNQQQYITQNNAVKVNEVNQENNIVKVISAGKVYKKIKQVGDFVRRGDVIAIIANENKLYAKLNVDESSIDKLNVGQNVVVQLNTQKDKKYNATISEILPVFDEQSQSFIVKVQFVEKPDFTINGTQLEANVLIKEKKNALLIPRSYLSYGNKVQLKNSKELKTINTGIISTEYVEVLSGLSENDVLVPIKPNK